MQICCSVSDTSNSSAIQASPFINQNMLKGIKPPSRKFDIYRVVVSFIKVFSVETARKYSKKNSPTLIVDANTQALIGFLQVSSLFMRTIANAFPPRSNIEVKMLTNPKPARAEAAGYTVSTKYGTLISQIAPNASVVTNNTKTV